MWSMPRSCSRPAVAAALSCALRAAVGGDEMRREQGHQDAVIEERRTGLARQRQMERDRLGQAQRRERGEHAPCRARIGRSDAGEERPARDRGARRLAENGAVDARAGVDALVERQGEAVREQPVVQAPVDRHAALEQLDALGVVDRLRGLDRPLRAELDHRLDQRGRCLAAGFGGHGRAAVAHRREANTGAPGCDDAPGAQRAICGIGHGRALGRRPLSTMRR